MAAERDSTIPVTWVAIDIAKKSNAVVVEWAQGRQERFRMANSHADHERLVGLLKRQPGQSRIAMEPTGTYHRPLAHRLLTAGFEVWLVSSLAAARFRDAMFNSWDKNDPKDALVILDLLKQGKVLRYYDALLAGTHDLEELSKTYMQIALARTRLHHSLLTHYLPLYWPEFERCWHTSRAEWIVDFLFRFPIPAAVREISATRFTEEAWALVGRKVRKREWMEELYGLAQHSIGLPIGLESLSVQTFRMQLERYRALIHQRDELENMAESMLASDSDFALLKTIPGIGSVLAMVILAESGDLRRFGHHRQYLKFCGMDLAKSQSGASRGPERLSKRGNARLRCAFWFAGSVAVRMRENSFRTKYERYIRVDPLSSDRRRKALSAVAAKMARVAYGVVKTCTPYQAYFEAGLPSGSIPLTRAVGATRTP